MTWPAVHACMGCRRAVAEVDARNRCPECRCTCPTDAEIDAAIEAASAYITNGGTKP